MQYDKALIRLVRDSEMEIPMDTLSLKLFVANSGSSWLDPKHTEIKGCL